MSCWRKDRPEAKRPNTAAWAAFDVYASDALPEAALGLRYAGSRSRRQQRCTGLLEQCALVAVGEQTVVADAVEAARQHMEREATQEFGGFELHHLTSVAARVVLVAEAHRIGSCGQQPIVGDRRAMRIAAQVLEHLLRSGEGTLGVYDPRLCAQASEQRRLEGPFAKRREELRAEDDRERLYREEEAAP